MKISGKNLVDAINLLTKAVTTVRFLNAEGRNVGENAVPQSTVWGCGTVVLQPSMAVSYLKIIEALKTLGVDAELVDPRLKTPLLKFTAKAGDDIIYILDMVMEQQAKQKKLDRVEWELAGLNQNVDQLIAQRPYVRRGMFSRGVNAFTHQVDVLKNLKEIHQKQH